MRFTLSHSIRSTFIILFLFGAKSFSQDDFSIEQYSQSIIKNGVSWKTGSYTYYPSFYTGFAPRIENPNRIHFQLSRGNQIRLTAPLDEYSILTYFYGLQKRETLFNQMVKTGLIRIEQQNQLALFQSILKSQRYQINATIENLSQNLISNEQLYDLSLKAMKELNPGRLFHIRIDMSAAIERWKNTAIAFTQSAAGKNLDEYISKNPQKSLTLINDLLWGRVDATLITPLLKAQLIKTLQTQSDFQNQALELFKLATEGRYEFKTLRNGTFQPSLYKDIQGKWLLEYPEFTAIYPNGSVKDYDNDRDGNRIPKIREIGVMNFISRPAHDVDHIRSESYYGYIPKMDYTTTGNGIHNPAVRTSLKNSIYKSLYQELNIPAKDNTLWIVARGGVSHGCTRMAAGHVLEVRDIFPSNPKRMEQVKYFGNNSEDYDLFDIEGTGQIQVMGVQYFLAYDIAADSGEGYREGAGLIPASLNRDSFYQQLYGEKQFRKENENYVFLNPYISQFMTEKVGSRGKAYSLQIKGDFTLYEQNYEQDKLQFFSMSTSQMSSLDEGSDHKSLGKQLVRIFGRTSGCGPFKKEFQLCNEDQFDQEVSKLIPQISKVK